MKMRLRNIVLALALALAMVVPVAKADEVASLEEHRPNMVIQGETAHAASEDLFDRLPPVHFVVTIGPALSHGMGGKTDLLFSYSIGLQMDVGHLSPRLFASSAHSYGHTGMSEFHGGLGVDYYFSEANSFLAGADFAYGYFNTALLRDDGGTERFTGASAGLRAGYAFFRNTPMCLTVVGSWRGAIGGMHGNTLGMYGVELGLHF